MKNGLFLLFGLMSFASLAQNGTLLSKKVHIHADSLQEQLNKSPLFSEIQANTELFEIQYLSDGLKINGYMAQPKKEGVYPVIIFNRGGNRDFGALNGRAATYLLGTMANWGYVAVACNYRGSGGSEGMEEFGGSDVNDILNLIPMLSAEPAADTSRMGVYGFSRGGMMTYLLLRQSCIFDAAIVGAGPTNLLEMISDRPEMETHVLAELIPNYNKYKEEELKRRSSEYWADELCKKTPLLILHGSSDWRVNPNNALNMSRKLFENKHPFRLLFLEGADHGLSEHRSLVWDNIRQFFDLYVKEGQSSPNMEAHGN